MNKKEINKNNLIIILIATILIVISHNLNIDWYIKDVVFPYTITLFCYILIFKKSKKINKVSFYYLMPIILILISNFIIKIDISNKILNIFILPLLLFIFFFTWLNKYFSLSNNWIELIFKIFPSKLFSNLKLLKRNKNVKNEKIGNIFLGVCLGGIIGIVLLSLLTSADAYFNAFVDSIFNNISINFDTNNIILTITSFILLFSIHVNILDNKDAKLKDINKKELIDVTVITILTIVNSIFTLFIISEISKLTNNFLELPIKYTYAGYAREGFFQLLFVTLINYSIIMYLLIKSNIIKNNIIVKRLVLLLIGFSIILIFNSYYRMYLYISNYGFTVLRLQVILFLLMELLLFVLLIIRIHKELKNKDMYIFIIMVSFYIINIYICNDLFIKFIS